MRLHSNAFWVAISEIYDKQTETGHFPPKPYRFLQLNFIQTVKNATINHDFVWSVEQWTAAWTLYIFFLNHILLFESVLTFTIQMSFVNVFVYWFDKV